MLTSSDGTGWKGLWKKMKVNRPVRQEDCGNKEKQRLEKQRGKWTGKRI